jgi:hypothetical protein
MTSSWTLRLGQSLVLRGRRPTWLTGVCVVGLVGIARSVLVLMAGHRHMLIVVTYAACLVAGVGLARLLNARHGPVAPRVASVAMGVTPIVLLDLVEVVPARPVVVDVLDLVAPSVVLVGVVVATVIGTALCRLAPDEAGRTPNTACVTRAVRRPELESVARSSALTKEDKQ